MITGEMRWIKFVYLVFFIVLGPPSRICLHLQSFIWNEREWIHYKIEKKSFQRTRKDYKNIGQIYMVLHCS